MQQSRRRFTSVGFPVTDRRVVRGGSWNNNQVDARAAYRNFNNPAERNNNLGFRVVCSSHILKPPSTAQVVDLSRALPPTGPAGASGIGRRPRFAARGEGLKMAQVSPVRTHSLWAIRRAHIKPRRLLGDGLEALHLFIQPPSRRPNSATIALTCRY